MFRIRAFSALLTGFLAVLLCLGFPPGIATAEPPSISIKLSFDRDSYARTDPIGAIVTLSNPSEENVFITKGVGSSVYYLQMRILDPAGRPLSLKRSYAGKGESPNRPVLPHVQIDNRLVEWAPCEKITPKFSYKASTPDLRDEYAFDQAGFYRAQVQISAMTFPASGLTHPEAVCDVNDFLWAGVLTSDEVQFFVAGSTVVKVLPRKWNRNWLRQARRPGDKVTAVIAPPRGGTVDLYDWKSLTFNGVPALRVEKKRPLDQAHDELHAHFDKSKAVRSVTRSKTGGILPAIIAGKYRSGIAFSGAAAIEIERAPIRVSPATR